MIEIKITGENANDAANQLLGFANFVAIGVNVVQAQQQAQPAQEAAQPGVIEETPKPTTTAAKRKSEAKKAPAPEPEQVDIEDVLSDDDVVEEVANPVPQNIEQLRELVMKVHTKVGAVEGSRIVQFYAPKISGVPVEKYKELSAKLYKALEG